MRIPKFRDKSSQTGIERKTQLDKRQRHLDDNTQPPEIKGHSRREGGVFLFDKDLRLGDSGG